MKDPISDRKLEANRENAKKSTGPKTSRGKAMASLNAMTHGVFATRTVAIGPPQLEDPKAFLAILEGLRVHYQPVGVLEDVKVEEIASINWKKIRLERYETAGISERVSAIVDAARHRTDETRLKFIREGVKLGSIRNPNQRPAISAAQLQEQVDLVDRLKGTDTKIEEESEFLAFVWFENHGEASAPPSLEDAESADELKRLWEGFAGPEAEDLKTRFIARMEQVLDAMWELRGETVPHEAAIVRSLVPDIAEMNKILRYSAHLVRLEEKAIAMLERLQAARREKEGRTR